MLASSFSENMSPVAGERKIYTIIVEEADFETIYWLLKFCYANWLLFREQDDPRTAMDGIGTGWSTKWSSLRGGEWDWKIFHKDDSAISDTRSVASGETRLSASEPIQPNNQPPAPSSASTSRPAPPNPKPCMVTPSTPQGTSTSSRRTIPGSSSTIAANNSTAVSRPKPVTMPYSPSHSGHTLSSRAGRQYPSTVLIPDPHPHPTPTPGPASALSMYQIAHRYAIPGLATLALEHMMSTLTPQSSFALLLATSVWDELHLLVEVCDIWLSK